MPVEYIYMKDSTMKKLFEYKINFIKRNPILSVGISFIKGVLITLLISFFLMGCSPVKYVNVEKKHNYYQRHRVTTYTIPQWIPGRGILLETRIYRSPKRSYAPRVRRPRP